MADLGRASIVAVGSIVVAGGVAAAAGAALTLGGVPVPLIAFAAVFCLNGIGWVVASAQRSERFYDLIGSASFITVVAIVAVARVVDGRAVVAVSDVAPWIPLVLVSLWAVRLGSFLFARIRETGVDGRFDQMKTSPARFAVPWSLQALWVILTVMPAVVVSSSPSPSGIAVAVGSSVWLVGFVVEVVADRQKDAFRRRRAADASGPAFIDEGLWRLSRHPNYVGEVLLWIGVFLCGVGVYQGAQWAVVTSPVTVFVLLRFVSGVPMLEARADARFGDDPAYQAYKARTPAFLLR